MLDLLVSIIMPTYNSAKYIEQTIDAIRAQTYTNWELLITDDFSEDNTIEIVSKYVELDSRIKFFKLNRNSGAGVARNNSIHYAQGVYIAFCDSDDIWLPEKLEKQIAFMQKNNCAFSFSSYLTCSEEGENIGIVICPRLITYKSNLRDCKIGCLTAIYDTQKLGKIYMPLIRKRQDWGLWMKILKDVKIGMGIKEPLAIYRHRNNSISRNKKSLIKYNIRVYQEVLGWSRIRATLFFIFCFTPSYIMKRLQTWVINS